MLTPKLQAAGLESSDVVIAGVMLQLGYGLISYPFAKFYMSNFRNLSPSEMDRLVSVISAIIVCAGLGLLIGTVVHADNADETVSMPLVCIGFLLWSAGLGISFYQSMTITNYLFASDKAKRRKATAFQSFSLGIGSCLFVVLFYYGMTPLTLTNNYIVILGIYIACAAFRIKYMVRDRFEEIPSLELPVPDIPVPSMVPGSIVLPSEGIKSTSQQQNQYQEDLGSNLLHDTQAGAAGSTSIDLHQNSLGGTLEDFSSESHARVGSSIAPEIPSRSSTPPPAYATERRPTRKEYWTSPVVWLTSVSAFFAYGIGSIFLNSLGNLAGDLVDDDMADAVTFDLTMTFLALIILSRLVSTIIYAHFNWPHVNTLWNALLFAGIVIYVAWPTLPGAYLACCFVGFGFGGIVSCMAVISTANFPGGVADGSVNLSIAFTVTSPGPFLLGLIETAIYEKSSLTDFNVDEIKSKGTYIYFLCATLFSTACSVALGIYLKRAFKLEQETLRALKFQPSLIEKSNSGEIIAEDKVMSSHSDENDRTRELSRHSSTRVPSSAVELQVM